MAQQDTIGGMFGPTPWEVEKAQRASDYDYAQSVAKMDALERGRASMALGARGLFRLGSDMLGFKNPEVEVAHQRQEAMKGVNFQNPETMRQRANEIRQSNPMIAARLDQMANQLQGDLSKQALDAATAQEKYYKSTLDAAQAAKALRDNPNLSVVEVGVKDKPGWMQKVLYDRTSKEEPTPVGEPYQTPQAMKISVGGDSGKEQYHTDEQGNVHYLKGGKLISTVAGAGKPSGAYGKERLENEQALITMDSNNRALSGKVDLLLNDDKSLSGIVGARGKLPSYPGSNASIAESYRDQLLGEIRTMGLQRLRMGGGIGAITEKEWNILADTVAALDFSKMDLPTAKKQLKFIKDEASRLYKVTQDLNERLFKRGGQPSGIPEVGTGLSAKDMQALEWAKKNPNDQRAVAIRKRLGQ